MYAVESGTEGSVDSCKGCKAKMTGAKPSPSMNVFNGVCVYLVTIDPLNPYRRHQACDSRENRTADLVTVSMHPLRLDTLILVRSVHVGGTDCPSKSGRWGCSSDRARM